MRTWRIAELVPMHKYVPPGEDGGLPDRLTPIDRFPVGGAMLGNIRMVSCKWEDTLPPGLDWFMWEPGALLLWTEAETPYDALKAVEPQLDYTLDYLSFQMQQPTKIVWLDVIDVTSPVQIGDNREYLMLGFPHGYQQRKLTGSVHMGVLHTALFPVLPNGHDALESQVQRALDWYIKSLHAQTDADQYILLWITLEVLASQQAHKVVEPTRLRCGHKVATCSDCNKDTSTFRQGATLRAFLSQFNLPETEVKALWGMRQIVHGAFGFDEERTSELVRLVQVLRSVVLASMKISLGINGQAPPILGFGGPAVAPNIGLSGERKLTGWHLAYEDRSPVPQLR